MAETLADRLKAEHRNRKPSSFEQTLGVDRVDEIIEAWAGGYGSSRIARALIAEGVDVSRQAVEAYIRDFLAPHDDGSRRIQPWSRSSAGAPPP